MYCYIWEYDVKPEHQASFEVLYGPDGAWVELFKTDPNYIRTELFRDRSNPRRYVTVDRWISKEACSSFRKINRERFDAIDDEGELYTSTETNLGEFDLAGAEGTE